MSVIWSWTYSYNLHWNNYLYFKGLLYIVEEIIMMTLLHMSGLENSECIWKIQRKRKWLYPFQWLKSRRSDVRWIFLSNSSEGGAVGIFKCGSRKEKYLGSYGNDIIGSAKESQISEKYWGEVGKGKRADIYLEVRKRRGHIFFEWNKCLCVDSCQTP